jgi:hypothetical protein
MKVTAWVNQTFQSIDLPSPPCFLFISRTFITTFFCMGNQADYVVAMVIGVLRVFVICNGIPVPLGEIWDGTAGKASSGGTYTLLSG